MKGRWNLIGLQFLCFFVLIFNVKIQSSLSLNDEGLVLLVFRDKVISDPYGAFASWNPNESDPCLWSGIGCIDGKVQILDMNGLLLEGRLASELGKLIHLKSLILQKNRFFGAIPKEIGKLTHLELLDLRDNAFSGKVPTEIGNLLSLKFLLLCGNKFEGGISSKINRLNLLSELHVDLNLASTTTGSYRKFGHIMWPLTSTESLQMPNKGEFKRHCSVLKLHPFKPNKDPIYGVGDSVLDRPASLSKPHMIQNLEILVNYARRKLLDHSSNLPAAFVSGSSSNLQIISLPTTHSSGAFPAIINPKNNNSPSIPPVDPPTKDTNEKKSSNSNGPVNNQQNQKTGNLGNKWLYFLIIPIVVVMIIIVMGLLFICRKEAVKTIGPWTAGLSGQLQKAFVTGVPKLNRLELEVACEDFSNIVNHFNGYTVYKGTLSSGVEIAVASTSIFLSKDWPKSAEKAYRKKIDTLSRINHKNFVNLLGFCEEHEPFVRMMVFEYAPNGSLFEHLHVKEMEHLDWAARMRVIMGVAYCLKYMHHDLNPPVSHSNVTSSSIFLTDDYAAKIAEICFLPISSSKHKTLGDDESRHSKLLSFADTETNVYSFGILLLEIISGKLQFSEEQGPIEKWAAKYLNDKQNISYMIDPTLNSFQDNELKIICEIIQESIQSDPRQRPTMREITSKLRQVIAISPDQATPRLSPLWWAELEILSVEAT